jgi:hypothetical protein
MGRGTQKGGAHAKPGKNAEGGPSFNRRHRNPKHGPAGSNPKGVAAQAEARKIVRD